MWLFALLAGSVFHPLHLFPSCRVSEDREAEEPSEEQAMADAQA
jgi:hypothetical protein